MVAYLKSYAVGLLQEKVIKAKKHLRECYLCPHECGVNRARESGFCRARDKIILASYGPHFGEEAVLVGRNGSGTIFFGYCNLRCVFCQNYELSYYGEGELISPEKLAESMLVLQNHYRCHNINLVTSTHFVSNILEAVLLTAEKGLNLPLVYNCGGYERQETLTLLEGVVDIYMPDFKYASLEDGQKYSCVKNYPEIAKKALLEMDRQVGGIKTDERGLAYQGLLIRHLQLPGGLEDTKEVLRFIKDELSPGCLVNLMPQYHPAHKAFEYEEISGKLSSGEYKEAVRFAEQLNLRLA
ncbi:MAG: radical SAM protein [Desulfotomaculum sp.]|nr:radical SAM protein [Desulfotomaculum sp.]